MNMILREIGYMNSEESLYICFYVNELEFQEIESEVVVTNFYFVIFNLKNSVELY